MNIGLTQLGIKLKNDPSLLEEKDFSIYHTWTEYVNRLVGFLSGNFMLATFIISLFLFRDDKGLMFMSLLNLIILVFQAWFGSIVVATNLIPWIITVHMLLALLLIGIQIKLINRARNQIVDSKGADESFIKNILIIAILISFVQIIFGAQVRQEIDLISDSFDGLQRDLWIKQLSGMFLIHRSFSIIVLGVNGLLIFKLFKNGLMKKRLIILGAILGIEVLTGIMISYLGVPRYAQPIHLVLATVMFGVQNSMFWELRANKEKLITPSQ